MFIKTSLEQILWVFWVNQQFTSQETVVAPQFSCKQFTQSPVVQFSRTGLAAVVIGPSRNSQASASAQVTRGWSETTGTPGNFLSYASLVEVNITRGSGKMGIGLLTLKASHTTSIPMYKTLFILHPNIKWPPKDLLQQVSCFSTWASLILHHSANQAKITKGQRKCSTQPEFYWCISLYGDQIRLAKACVISEESLITCPSMWLLMQSILSLVSASAKHSFMNLP